MKILLVCAGGMSSSLLVSKMLEAAPQGTVVEAISVFQLEEKVSNFDVILVGPQLRFQQSGIRRVADAKGKPVGFIEPQVYGMCLGREVIEQAQKLLDGQI